MTQPEKYTARVLHWGDLEDWQQDALPADENGYVTGYLVNTEVPLIIGEVMSTHNDFIQPEFWAKVDHKTIVPVARGANNPVEVYGDRIIVHYDDALGKPSGYLAGQAYFDKQVRPFATRKSERGVSFANDIKSHIDPAFAKGFNERLNDYFNN